MIKLETKKAPEALGPYSQGYKVNGLIFTSGQIPINVETGELEQDIKKATKIVLGNLKAVLQEAGADLDTVIKTTVFMKDLNDFAQMNEAYAEVFGEAKPARSTVQVADLPKGAVLEIEAIAVEK